LDSVTGRSSTDDAALCERCRAGDEAAWQALVERYAPLIWSIPRRYGLGRAACEDVFSEVCLALVRSLKGLRDPQTLPKWLIRTTTRATWEVARKGRASPPPEDLPALTGSAPPDELVSLLEEEQVVREGLQGLPERCRRLLELLYFAAATPSYDEIAAELGVPRGSLGPTRQRCLEKLRALVEPRFGGLGVSGGAKRPPQE